MTRKPGRDPEVRGARDLAALWHDLPAASRYFLMRELPPGIGVSEISDFLRAQAWRAHCADGAAGACIDRKAPCAHAGTGRCRADVLIPVYPGGGAPQWRMASLLVQWCPGTAQLRLLALGAVACEQLAWAAALLQNRFGFGQVLTSPVRRFGDLVPTGGRSWRLELVAPWLIDKSAAGTSSGQSAPLEVGLKLRESLAARGHKLTGLCSADPLWQRLGGHLSRHVSAALLPQSLVIRRDGLIPKMIGYADMGTDYDALVWTGQLDLDVAAPALPWLALLDACGIGENVDKGFGQVELVPLSD